MAWTAIDHTAVDRTEVSRAAFGYSVVDDLNDLNTRTSTVETRTTDASTGNTALGSRLSTVEGLYVPTTRTVSAGSGLTGGGDLSANRSFAANFGDGSTQIATGARALALEQGRAFNRYGRWYSTETATHTASAEAVGSWTAIGTPLTDVTVSGTSFTIVNAGVYELTFNYSGTWGSGLAVGTGMNANVFIADSGLTVVYAQSQMYYEQYTDTTAKNITVNICSGPVAIAASTVVKFSAGGSRNITTVNSLNSTFCAIRRIS